MSEVAASTARPAATSSAKGRWRYFIPLIVVVLLLVVLGVGLKLDPREVPSPFIGKPAPAFSLPRLDQPQQPISKADMQGKVWLLNVWASWCVTCREEHPVLLSLSKTGVVPIVGLNYKDERDDGLRWLSQFGNPYQTSAYDHDGKTGIDYGVYGVPETFVIDKHGIVRYKQIGAVTDEALKEKILPMVSKLNAES
jgi:cytochrome c biogenesis protein CcmG/thiol:disulfide interchange protein DsbE